MDQQQKSSDDTKTATNIQQTSSSNAPQLPDLLNGTEPSKDNSRPDIDKLNLLKGLNDYGLQQGYNSTGKQETTILNY